MDDVLVVGGGIIGTLVALECRARGADVMVVDAGSGRPSASWAGGGILSPLFPWRYADAWLPLTADAGARYRYWQTVIAEAGLLPPEINACGMLVRAADDQGVPDWSQRSGVAVAAAADSGLPAGFVDAADWWLPEVAAVRNPHWLRQLRELARLRGVRWRQGVVSSVRDSASVVLEGEAALEAGRVVVTAGYWSQKLLHRFGHGSELQPVKGEMLLFRLQPGEIPAILLADDGYLIPRSDGLVLAGSTLAPGETDQRPSPDAFAELNAMAARWYEPLAGLTPVAQWSGVRPGSTRALPLIGPVAENGKVWVATGHYRNGLVSAPATASLLAGQLAGEAPFCDAEVYWPSSSDSSSDSF